MEVVKDFFEREFLDKESNATYTSLIFNKEGIGCLLFVLGFQGEEKEEEEEEDRLLLHTFLLYQKGKIIHLQVFTSVPYKDICTLTFITPYTSMQYNTPPQAGM